MNRAASMRYARALLDVSQQDADPDRVDQELSAFVDLMASHSTLAASLLNPSVPPATKRGVMTAVLACVGEYSAVTQRLLLLLADRDRLSLLPEILTLYRDQLKALRGILQARVTTASELAPDRLQSIARTLGDATGKQVEVKADVDTALLGGMVTQIGSTVYDGSVAGHLDRLRRRFLNRA